MRVLSTLGQVLPVLATFGLLGLWLYQQFGIEERLSEQRKLSSARSTYTTYQSNNALFNAINELGGAPKIRTFQIYNYELGLAAIEAVLSDSIRGGIPAPVHAYTSSEPFEKQMERTQKRLEMLQDQLMQREAAVQQAITNAKKKYLWLYIGISLIGALGAILGALEKLSKPT